MSSASTVRIANPIKGPGLKAPGVVILQALPILIFETIEYQFTKVGLFTGLAIWAAFIIGLKLGRPGTQFAAVVNPPLAFFFSTLFLIATLGGAGLKPSRIGLDLITSLSGVATFLVTGAIAGWIAFFVKSRPRRS
ncbi:MAG: hypothetical protein RL414_1111 [Actinomycetota bacterium]|jgi:hypothetical protein